MYVCIHVSICMYPLPPGTLSNVNILRFTKTTPNNKELSSPTWQNSFNWETLKQVNSKRIAFINKQTLMTCMETASAVTLRGELQQESAYSWPVSQWLLNPGHLSHAQCTLKVNFFSFGFWQYCLAWIPWVLEKSSCKWARDTWPWKLLVKKSGFKMQLLQFKNKTTTNTW